MPESENYVAETILIVDNEEDMLSILRLILERSGYQVIESTSGQQALEVLQASIEPGQQPVSLVLLDIMMPDLSGIELCHAIRQEEAFAALPVMMLTALSSVTDRLLAYEAGADDYLVKPVDHRELLARVQAQLRLRRAERDALRRIRELDALHTVSDALNRSLDLDTMLRHTLGVTCDVLGTQFGGIYVVEREHGVARLGATYGFSEAFQQHPHIAEIVLGERNVGQVAVTGRSIVRTDLSQLPDPILRLINDEGIASSAFVPIRDEHEIVGVLLVGTSKRHEFRFEETVLLETIGSQVGTAMARARLHQEVQEARDQARELARRVVRAQEDERRRIARELHDQLGQATTALLLDLEMLRESLGADDAALDARLAEDIDIATTMLSEIKTLSLELRPAVLDDLGLEPALRWYVDRVARRSGLSVELKVEVLDEAPGRLPQEIETVAFRCLQEILTNVLRHAEAKRVDVNVTRSADVLRLVAQDDGVGFSLDDVLGEGAAKTAFGLNSARERVAMVGGRCQFHSQPGEGTRVVMEIPLEAPPATD